MPWRATWSQVLAGAVASREEPKLEQGCGGPVWRTHTGAGSSWRTGLCGKDPCWRSEELAECHEGLYAKIFSQAECVLPMIMIVGDHQPVPATSHNWIHPISSPTPAEEVDDKEFWWAPGSQKGLTHPNRTAL